MYKEDENESEGMSGLPYCFFNHNWFTSMLVSSNQLNMVLYLVDIHKSVDGYETSREADLVRKPRHCACSPMIFLRKATKRFLTKNIRV